MLEAGSAARIRGGDGRDCAIQEIRGRVPKFGRNGKRPGAAKAAARNGYGLGNRRWTENERACSNDRSVSGDLHETATGASRTAVELAQDLLDLGAEAGRNVRPRQRIGHIGGEEADLRAAVETAAFEFQAVERLRPRQLDHGVGELDFAAGAALLGAEQIEDLRL